MSPISIFISGIPVAICQTPQGWSVTVDGMFWGYFTDSTLAATAALAVVNCHLGNWQVA